MLRLTLSSLVLVTIILRSAIASAQDFPSVAVPFDGIAVSQLLGSAIFAASCIAILRKAWPAIDGVWVYVVGSVPAIGAAVLARHAAEIQPWVWEIVGPITVLVTTFGGYQGLSRIAEKGGTRKTGNVTPLDSAPLDVIPPPPKVPTITELERDTKPSDPPDA